MKEQRLTFELLKRIAEDDKSAFATFFQRYQAKLIRFALMFVSSYADAEDVVSETLIKILKQRKKLFEIQNFEGYLYQAIKNQALNHIGKIQRRQEVYSLSIPDDQLTSTYVQPLEAVLEKELRSLITKSVESLPPQRKIIYKMIKDDGLKCKEAAALLDIAEKTVKKHLELAIRDIKEAVEDYYSDTKATPIYKKIICLLGPLLSL